MSIVHGSMPGGVMEEKPADEDVAKALADPEVPILIWKRLLFKE